MTRVNIYTSFYLGQTQECGSTMIELSGSISAPDSDGDGYYEPNLDCWWTLEAKEGHVVQINIQTFDVGYSVACEADFLQVSIKRSAKLLQMILFFYVLSDMCAQNIV